VKQRHNLTRTQPATTPCCRPAPAPATCIPTLPLQALSYLEVKGSGLANQCPTVG